MAINLTLRSEKGAPLTHQELDANFLALSASLGQVVSDASGSGTFLVSSSLSGSTLTFEKGDGSTYSHELPINLFPNQRFPFTGSTNFSISHSLDSKDVLIEIYQENGSGYDVITPTTTTVVDNNNIDLVFAGATTGYAVVGLGGVSKVIETQIESAFVESGSFIVSGSVSGSTIYLHPVSGSPLELQIDITQDTGSYVLSSDTGSFVVSSSYDSTTSQLTFVQGDGSSVVYTLATGSVSSSIDTGSFVVSASFDTGSNTLSVEYGNGNTDNLSLASLTGSAFDTALFVGTSLVLTNGKDEDTVIDLSALTGSSSDTGSFMVTGSVSGNVFTFTKGDGSTFDLEIPTGSVSDSGSFVVTGSISGSVLNFEKGDGTSFDIQLPSSTISDTGSFLITGSVSGSLLTLEKGDGSSFDLVLPSGTGDTGSLIVTASLAGSTLNFEKGDGSSFNVTLTGQGTPDGTYRLERTDGAEASLRGFGINANSIYDATEISINNVDYRYVNKGDYYYRITTGSLLRFYNYTTGDYFAKEVTDVTPGYSAFTFEVRNVYGDEIPVVINELYEVDVDSAGSSTSAPIPSGSFLISASLSGSTLTFEKNDLSTFDLELPETDSGSLLISASLSGSTLIFEKGDSSTFGIDLVTDTGSFVVTGSVSGSLLIFEKGDGSTFDLEVLTSSYAHTASYSHYAVTASYVETASIYYDTGSSTGSFDLSRIQVNDYDDNVGVTFINGKLTLTFGTPEEPLVYALGTSGWNGNRFNQQSDSYTVIANWLNNGYTLVSASLFDGDVLVDGTTDGQGISFATNTTGSEVYYLYYTASSPLDGTLYTAERTLIRNLSKGLPSNPTLDTTPAVQLGTDNNEIEVGATGSIAITGSRGSSNGWNFDTLLFNPSGSYPVTGSNTGSADILISVTASYISPPGSNIPDITSERYDTETYTKIISVRYGASVSASFSEGELLDLAYWDTSLGGSIGTIDKGVTSPSGDDGVIAWTQDKYHYIVYDAQEADLVTIVAGGFDVLNAFTSSIVGDYKVYKTIQLQSGYSGTSITYTLS